MRQKPLRGGNHLRAKRGLGRAPKNKNSVSELKKEARRWFNKMVKYRDSTRMANGNICFQCITCGKWVLFRDADGKFYLGAHAGHFMPETRNNTRFNEMNVNGICKNCNYYDSNQEEKYALALDLKYGDGTAEHLRDISRVKKQFTQKELLSIIECSKEQISFYENTLWH